jgi:uncharacterized protein (DUF1015 family)
MATIQPFKAYRPTPDKIALVSCRAYDDYEAGELGAILAYNPFSFLHVLHPAYLHLQKNTHAKRFTAVHHQFLDFVENQILEQETTEVMYLYEIQTPTNSFTGIVAAIAIADYLQGNIVKHENTLEYRVDLFEEFLEHAKINSEPVLLTYPDQTEIRTWIEIQKQNAPNLEFSTTNWEKHRLWKIETIRELEWLENYFAEIPQLYIADGHHRMESTAQHFLRHPEGIKNQYGMAFLIAESQVKIHSFYRLLHSITEEQMTEMWKQIPLHYSVLQSSKEIMYPKQKGQVVYYANQEFHLLESKKELSSTFDIKDLDSQQLLDNLLQPVLQMHDLRNDDRIEYFPGNQTFEFCLSLLQNKTYQIAFILYPNNINDMIAVANAIEIMPPKSTYIEPKFRSGLIVYPYFE